MTEQSLTLKVVVDGSTAVKDAQKVRKQVEKALSKTKPIDPFTGQQAKGAKRAGPNELMRLNYRARRAQLKKETREKEAAAKKVARLQKKLAADLEREQKKKIAEMTREHKAAVKKRARERVAAEKKANALIDAMRDKQAKAQQRRNQVATNKAARARLLQIRRQEIAARKAAGSNADFGSDKDFLIGAHRGGQFGRGKGTVKGSKSAGRRMSQLFQVQQTVEDFSFAGFRGASNNLALLASQMSGPMGIIALGGLTTATVLQMSGAFDKFGKSAEAMAARTKKSVSAMIAFAQARERARLDFAANTPETTDDIKSARKAVAGQKTALGIRGKVTGKFQTARDILKRITTLSEARKAITGPMMPGEELQRKAGIQGMDPQAALQKVIDEQKKAEDAYERATGRPLQKRDMPREGRDLAGDFGEGLAEPSAVEEHMKRLNELVTERQLSEGATRREIEEREKLIEKEVKNAEERTKFLERINSLEGVQAVAQRKRLKGFEKEREQLERVREMIAESSKKDAERLKAGDPGMDEDRFNKRRKEHVAILEQTGRQLDDLQAAEEARKDAATQLVSAARSELSIAKSISAEKERQIQSEKEKIKALKEQARTSGDSYASRRFGATQGMLTNAHQQQLDAALQRRANAIKGRFGGRVKDDVLQQMIQNDAAGFQKHADAMLKARQNAMLERRGQALSGQAAAAGRGGDFAQQRKLLQELQQLQLGVAGSSANAQRAQGALAAADKTQKLITQSFQQQQQAAQANINKFQQAKTAADGLATSIDQLIQKSGKVDPLAPNALTRLNQYIGQATQLRTLLQGIGGKVGGIKLPKPLLKARGGSVPGTGSGDKVPALLEPGEFVIRKSAVQRLGVDTLEEMNANRFAGGGSVNSRMSKIHLQQLMDEYLGTGGIRGRRAVSRIKKRGPEAWQKRSRDRMDFAKWKHKNIATTSQRRARRRMAKVKQGGLKDFQIRARDRLKDVVRRRREMAMKGRRRGGVGFGTPGIGGGGGGPKRGALGKFFDRSLAAGKDRQLRQQRMARFQARGGRSGGGGGGGIWNYGAAGYGGAGPLGLDPTLGFRGTQAQGGAIDLNLVSQISPEVQAMNDRSFAQQKANLLKGKYPITPMGKDLRNPGSMAFSRRTTMSRFGGGIQGLSGSRLFGETRLVQDRTRQREEYLRQIRYQAAQQRAAIMAQKKARSQLQNPFAMKEGGLVGGTQIRNSFTPGAISVNVNNSMQLEEVMRSIQKMDSVRLKRRD